MNYKIFISVSLFLILYPLSIFAQDSAPTINNVTFSQRTDGSYFVDIFYDVNDPDGDSLFISMKVSNDDGISWNFSGNNTTGDIGSGITNGTSKHIIWDFKAEYPDTCCDNFMIKIIADDDVKRCPGIETVTYAGQTYNTVQIGDQCWLRENLNVGTMTALGDSAVHYFQHTDNGILEKYCYNDNVANCNTYGGLYEWTEAMQYVTTEGTQGICPSGWHIPTHAEMQTLQTNANFSAATLLDVSQTMTNGFTATNETGFSALCGGDLSASGSFMNLGLTGYFWSSTESSSYGRFMWLNTGSFGVYFNSWLKYSGISVRCLKD